MVLLDSFYNLGLGAFIGMVAIAAYELTKKYLRKYLKKRRNKNDEI